MIRVSALLGVAVLLAACNQPAPTEPTPPPAPPPPPAAEAPVPGEDAQAAYPNCQWGEVKGAGLSIWSFACANDRLVADDALPGFQREVTDAAGQVIRTPAIRILTKAADAPLDAVLDQVRAASPGGEACVIEPGSHGDFVLMPTGKASEDYQKFVRGEADGPSMPCGPLGPKEGGGYTLRAVEGAADKVALIDWGTSTPIFDPDTLRPQAK